LFIPIWDWYFAAKFHIMNNTVRVFRTIAIAEGISFLTLLLIAMPLKYFANMPEAVKITGWIHGALFMLYIPFVFLVKRALRWSWLNVFVALAASVLPFGTFVLDKKLIQHHSGE